MVKHPEASGVYYIFGVVRVAEQGSRQAVASCALNTTRLERERERKEKTGKESAQGCFPGTYC